MPRRRPTDGAAGGADTNQKRESGKKAQEGNIMAAKAVSDIIRTTLGPRSMLKMLLDAQVRLLPSGCSPPQP